LALEAARLFVSVDGNIRPLKQTLRKAEHEARRSGGTISRALRLSAAGAFSIYGLKKFADFTVLAASDINESLTKNQVLFKSYAKDVEDFSARSTQAFGISRAAALQYTGVFGNLFTALGLSSQKSAQFSVGLTKLAADMASFNNSSIQDALEAIRSGLVGEVEPLRRFGVNLNDATLRQTAMSMGLTHTTKNVLTPYQKAMAATALITKQTGSAHGDFERTSEGTANQLRILTAEIQDAGAELGVVLLPTFRDGVTWLNKFIREMQNGTGQGGKFVDTLKNIWAAFRPLLSTVKDITVFLAKHPKLLATAAGTWAAYKVAALASLAAVKIAQLGLFGGKAQKATTTAAGTAGTAAGLSFGKAFAIAAGGLIVAGINRAVTEALTGSPDAKGQTSAPSNAPPGTKGFNLLDWIKGGFKNPFADSIPKGTGNTTRPGRGLGTGRSSTLTGQQRRNLKIIVEEGQRRGASRKVILAAVEAAMVESELTNLAGGDRDSVGVFQQRPSQGWTGLRNVRKAAGEFYSKAIPKAGAHGTAGSLAQSVQRSAYPGRYNQRRGDAMRALGMGGSPGSGGGIYGLPSAGGGGGGGGAPPKHRNIGTDIKTGRVIAYISKRWGLKFTSGKRSAAHNRAVNGIENSDHLKGTTTNPGAADFVGSMSAMRAAGKWAEGQGWNVLIHNAGSGLHLHVGFGSGRVDVSEGSGGIEDLPSGAELGAAAISPIIQAARPGIVGAEHAATRAGGRVSGRQRTIEREGARADARPFNPNDPSDVAARGLTLGTRINRLRGLQAFARQAIAKLKTAIAKLGTLIKALRKKLKILPFGQRRPTLDKIKAYQRRIAELKREINELGGTITDTETDIIATETEIGQLEKPTPGTVEEGQGNAQIDQALRNIQTAEDLGEISHEEAQRQRRDLLQMAAEGRIPGLTREERAAAAAQLRDMNPTAPDAPMTNAAAQQIIDAVKELTDTQQRVIALSTSQSNVMVLGLLNILNGGIGGPVGLGSQHPAIPGRFANA